MNLTPGQMTVDDCIEVANRMQIFQLASTQYDPGRHCISETLSCPSWADCEIAGKCLGSIDE